MKIGLALSGGGIRATVFHLGILARFASQSLLENITFLSTVSGGSLAIALVWVTSGRSWPTSEIFLKQCVPEAQKLTTERNLQSAYILQTLLSPWRLVHGRASILGRVLRNTWGLQTQLSELPDKPRWIINATCYETGKNWRFMRTRMGDYLAGYVIAPALSVADSVAASAAVPALIGSLALRTDGYNWQKFDRTGKTIPHEVEFSTLHLWDGGVYDNLGVEALFKPSGGYREGLDFLVVSDASSPLERQGRGSLAPLRLLRIATDQVRSLRSRTLVAHLQDNRGSGVYLKIGNTEEQIYRAADRPLPSNWNAADSLKLRDVEIAAKMNTTLRRISSTEFDLLYRHGYQVADATLSAYCSDLFHCRPLTIS